MSTDTELEEDDAPKWSPWAIVAAALLALMFGGIIIAGVSSYFYVDPQEAAKLEEERKKKEEEDKKKEDEITFRPPVILPSEPKSPLQFVKPGHWATSTQRMRANYRDFIGESRTVIVDKQKLPYTVTDTPFQLFTLRPVALSKGQPKNIENTFFVPQTNALVYFYSEYSERGLGLAIPPQYTQLTRMPSFQYHFVVLAKEPARYSFIKTLDSVSVPYGGETEYETRHDELHYRVDQLDVRQTIPLSDNPLTWTSIAYILWDEVDPHLFAPAQEKALVDWLNWGGQLIVNGPDSLDLLKGSFLEPYMPVRNGGPWTIAADVLDELNGPGGWMVSTRRVPGAPLTPTVPWSGIKLDIVPDVQATKLPNTGGLLVERPVGRGRIVVSAMQLSERDLINWRSGFDSLFNACLLRRPPRIYIDGTAGPVLHWADPELRDRRLDARLTTTLDYFARDLGVNTAYQYREVQDAYNQVNRFGQPLMVREYVPPDDVGGLGAWNDFCATAKAARTSLRAAAGVEVPDSSFVVVCLAVYLTVLVPLNWLVFNALGRVEWAWIAAPFIAIAGTWVVVQQARLDIGFVRAHTEIGILEQQPDHARALLSRYSALYTSLSTTYDLEFANLTTLAAPFPASENDPMLSRMTRMPLDFQRQDTVRLTGLPVSSASTNFVRSEQMFPLDGAIRLGTTKAGGMPQIENLTQFKLESVAIVERPATDSRDQRLRGMWIGELLPGKSIAKLRRMSFVTDEKTPFAKDRADEARRQSGQRLDLEPMFQLALARANIEPGETRLVARIDKVLPGQTITPVASQIRGANLVVAHLQYAPLAQKPARPDKNTRQEVKAAQDEDVELDMLPTDQNPSF
jgi:hypothetical protein